MNRQLVCVTEKIKKCEMVMQHLEHIQQCSGKMGRADFSMKMCFRSMHRRKEGETAKSEFCPDDAEKKTEVERTENTGTIKMLGRSHRSLVSSRGSNTPSQIHIYMQRKIFTMIENQLQPISRVLNLVESITLSNQKTHTNGGLTCFVKLTPGTWK